MKRIWLLSDRKSEEFGASNAFLAACMFSVVNSTGLGKTATALGSGTRESRRRLDIYLLDQDNVSLT